MDDLTDAELLAEFARSGSNPAFAALVKRHVNLVYSVALRASGNPHHAQEISQSVFLILARKAGSLSSRVVLSGWLYQTTRLTASNHRRDELRRRRREQEAAMQPPANESELENWKQLAPLLDDAMDRLGHADRDVLVLRYFEDRTAAEIAKTLQTTEAAVHKRAGRSLEKLRKILSRRGVALAGGVIGSAIATNSMQAAPEGLAPVVVAVAAGKGAASASMATLVDATLKSIAWLKVKFAAGVGAAVLVAGALTAVVVSRRGAEPPANPELVRQVLGAAFERASVAAPARMRFEADVEVEQRAWTESQIRDEALRIQGDARLTVGQRAVDAASLPRAERERVEREQADVLRVQEAAVRWVHQDKRTYVGREWVSGSSWRLDKRDTTPRPEALKAATPELPAGVSYDSSYFGCHDTNWTQSMPHSIDHRIRSAWFGRNNWKPEAFGEATSLERPVALLLAVLLGDGFEIGEWMNAQSQPAGIEGGCAGIALSTNKLESLALGVDKRWLISTGLTNRLGRELAFVRIKGRSFSLVRGVEATFFADPANRRHLHRVELARMPFLKTPYVSIREDFDRGAFPRTWIVETPSDSPVIKRTVRFKAVEVPAEFDDREVLAPEIPRDYRVNGRLP